MAVDMQTLRWKLSSRFRSFFLGEGGQDIVEYALVLALVALAGVASMQGLAADINNAFLNVGNTLANTL